MLEAHDVQVIPGITDQQIDELIYYSNSDKNIVRFTSDQTRFKDRSAFESWIQHGRIIYTLTGNDGSLLGIIWFGEKAISANPDLLINPVDLSSYGITFAIRTYSEARGRGLSKMFMQNSFENFRSLERTFLKPGIWLEVSSDNTPAISVYERHGFQKITNPDESDKILMILP